MKWNKNDMEDAALMYLLLTLNVYFSSGLDLYAEWA